MLITQLYLHLLSLSRTNSTLYLLPTTPALCESLPLPRSSSAVYAQVLSCFRMFIDNFYPVPNPIMGNTSSSQVQKCLVGAVGKDMAFKTDPLFQLSHVKPYNLGMPSIPAAVTYPKTTDQIAKIVKCAVDNSLKVQPRCGGHSYANYGT
jgi:hypothetical protein